MAEVRNVAFLPLGYQQLSVTNAAAGTATVPDGTYLTLITPEAACRWRDDGTAPTTSVGTLLGSGATLRYDGPVERFKVIMTSGTANVNFNYYRRGGVV